MKNVLVNVYQHVHLINRQNMEVLMDKKQLHLMVKSRILNGHQYDVHHLLINVFLYVQIQGVDDHSDLKRITSDACNEQIDELLVRNLIFLCRNEFLVVIFFAVHLEHNVDIISCN